jgi:hypothetical protein
MKRRKLIQSAVFVGAAVGRFILLSDDSQTQPHVSIVTELETQQNGEVSLMPGESAYILFPVESSIRLSYVVTTNGAPVDIGLIGYEEFSTDQDWNQYSGESHSDVTEQADSVVLPSVSEKHGLVITPTEVGTIPQPDMFRSSVEIKYTVTATAVSNSSQ